MGKRPISFTISLGFILINAFIWLVFAALVLIGIRPFDMLSVEARGILAALAVLATGVIFFLFSLLRKQNRIAYYLTLVILVGFVILTFMDQVGPIDLVYLFIVLTPFVLLIINRRWFFKVNSEKG